MNNNNNDKNIIMVIIIIRIKMCTQCRYESPGMVTTRVSVLYISMYVCMFTICMYVSIYVYACICSFVLCMYMPRPSMQPGSRDTTHCFGPAVSTTIKRVAIMLAVMWVQSARSVVRGHFIEILGYCEVGLTATTGGRIDDGRRRTMHAIWK